MASASSYSAKAPVPCDNCVERLVCKRYCSLFRNYLNGMPTPKGLAHTLNVEGKK